MTVARKLTQNEMGNLGCSCLIFSEAGLGYCMVRVRAHSNAMYAMQRGGKGEQSRKGESYREQTTRHCMRRESGIQIHASE